MRSLARRSLVAILVGSLAALLTLSTGVAGAEVPKLVPNGRFHAFGASGVAVDQSSGDVFVSPFLGEEKVSGRPSELNFGGSIQKFDASGNVLSPPGPFGEVAYYGAAVNPTNRHVYVASLFGVIDVYDPNTGEPLPSFAVPPFFNLAKELGTAVIENNAQIATDSAGNVYVPNVPENVVREYNEKGELQHEFKGSVGHELKGPTGVAVDWSGDVWVADDGANRVEEFSAPQPGIVPDGTVESEFASEGVRALALDGHGNVFAVVNNRADFCGLMTPSCEHLVEYSSTGVQLADVGAGYFGVADLTLFEGMVAVDQASGRVYVTDGGKNTVWVFQPPVAPVLGRESAVEVGASEAKLGALVNPGGTPATYRFEYDTRPYVEGEERHGTSVPAPEGDAGEGFTARTVWASARDLVPGTTYHYRVVVTSGFGVVAGPDQTFTTQALGSCPNEAARGGFSAALPDCRAYELVTPVGRTSVQADEFQAGEEPNPFFSGGGARGNFAADDGDRFTFFGLEVVPGAQSAGLNFIAVRGTSGWSMEDALPLSSYTGDRCSLDFTPTSVLRFSRDLTRSVIVVGSNGVDNGGCAAEPVELASGEPLGAENLLLRDNVDASYQLIDVTPSGVVPNPATLVAASADLKVVVFSEGSPLTSGATYGVANLYEWREGVVRLLPAGMEHVSVLSDGSEIFFTTGGKLYARLNYGERTVQLDASQEGSAGGGGLFKVVTADGSQVFFTDDATAGLTKDTVAGSGTNLYRYDVNTGRLIDLTPVGEANASLAGISEDGSYVYFSSDGVQSGSQPNQFGETPENGKANLYVEHEGTVTFVMHGAGGELSANGAFLAFVSTVSLTGYDNLDSSTGTIYSGKSDPEIYLYSAAANRFECASCNPSGEQPTNGGVILGEGPNLHFVSDAGQVFFETGEALLPRDTDGVTDVYEYEYGGGLHLISAGTSSRESFLLDSTPSGSDVFFLTRQKLIPRDNFQEANKIYDARVDGGFPEPAVPPACTTPEGCRGANASLPSLYGAPASQTFNGAGNLAPLESKPAAVKTKTKPKRCGRGSVKRKGRCVRAGKAKKAGKSNHNRGRR